MEPAAKEAAYTEIRRRAARNSAIFFSLTYLPFVLMACHGLHQFRDYFGVAGIFLPFAGAVYLKTYDVLEFSFGLRTQPWTIREGIKTIKARR